MVFFSNEIIYHVFHKTCYLYYSHDRLCNLLEKLCKSQIYDLNLPLFNHNLDILNLYNIHALSDKMNNSHKIIKTLSRESTAL